MKINVKYLPKRLTLKDKKKQLYMLMRSKKMYKKGDYYTRKTVKSYTSIKSKHVDNAKKIYNVDSILPNNDLVKATGCSKKALSEIVRKGEGAYYSSGSRPNQTPQSWGIARLASAISSGKAAAVDYKILENGCRTNSKALALAKRAKRKYGYGTRRAPKIRVYS